MTLEGCWDWTLGPDPRLKLVIAVGPRASSPENFTVASVRNRSVILSSKLLNLGRMRAMEPCTCDETTFSIWAQAF